MNIKNKDEPDSEDQASFTFLDELMSLSELENELDIDASMKLMAGLVAKLLNTSRCSLMIVKRGVDVDCLQLRVCAHYGDLPNEAYDEMADLESGISGHVMKSGKPLLIEHIGSSEFGSKARFSRGSQDDGFIICPLIIAETVIGVLNISQPADGRVFGRQDMKIASFAALSISQSIQIYQLKNLFRSNFVKLTLANEAGNNSSKTLNQLINNNEKAIKVLAKSFYSELKKAGFSRDLIIGAASEIISLVTNELKTSQTNS